MKTNSEIRALALDSLKGRWTPAIVATLVIFGASIVYSVISGGPKAGLARAIVGCAFALVVYLPLAAASYNAFKAFSLRQSNEVLVPMIEETKSNYVRYLLSQLLVGVVVVIGCFLFIVPGVILALGLSMVPYIVKDNPELGIEGILRKSWEMTKGYKTQLLLLSLSFIGWIILCIFTLGIGFLWLEPYIFCSFGQFYEELKANA